MRFQKDRSCGTVESVAPMSIRLPGRQAFEVAMVPGIVPS
jgi:hypothetical protein